MKISVHHNDGRSLAIEEGGWIGGSKVDLRWMATLIGRVVRDDTGYATLTLGTNEEYARLAAEELHRHEENILQSATEILRRRAEQLGKHDE